MDYDLTPENQTAFTDTKYKFNNNHTSDEVLPFTKILESVKYDRTKDSISNRTKSIKNDLSKRVDKVRNSPLALPSIENEEKSDDLEGQGV